MIRTQAAATVVRDAEGRFLLILRGHAPAAGRWSLPGGRVESGESLKEAAVRETLEETGLQVRIDRLLGSLEIPHGPDRVFEVHDFLARRVGGTLQAGDDAADAGWFTYQEMTTMPLTEDLLGFLHRTGLLP
ncbi:NUDIX domain-containing protein [Arthrobacter echini]|uniref:NUDIX domain-containing protein n=1 Tax=Arthrobacter echini TaxID=1529066 RepID=A0A4S5EAK3_9MICC|nr:NUDIX domain-containing protein [Arthrobacter echini]